MTEKPEFCDRLHDTQDGEALLGQAITRSAARGGTTVIPAFAVGRAQALLYAIYRLKTSKQIPDLPVYLNHGEAAPADALRQRIERELGWSVSVPRLGQSMQIGR